MTRCACQRDSIRLPEILDKDFHFKRILRARFEFGSVMMGISLINLNAVFVASFDGVYYWHGDVVVAWGFP